MLWDMWTYMLESFQTCKRASRSIAKTGSCFTRLDCAGVAQTHFGRVAILLDRVIMQARAPIWTFPLFLSFCVFFRRRFGLRRRGPNTHLREKCIELLCVGRTFLDKVFGSVEYTKSNVFTAPVFQNGIPACIITLSGLSRGAFWALFGTLSQDT